ncbi:MAG TPA: M20/M25/M40 family metallo-hydrolase [Acidobacteriaceae bacterium]|jgi:acetylornithine deacetylase/succinyl-diaminopimelate desuccinylase-like protein|nr:M20/M25/M40 family metallo-hydrolase [Acidobacteriaceae bacterium]
MPEAPATSAFQTVSQLAALPAVHRAFQWLHLQEPRLRSWQREITSIPAPPFGEHARATWLCDQFTTLGLEDVHIDACGNALGWLRKQDGLDGRDDSAVIRSSVDMSGVEISDAEVERNSQPCTLLSAHIDTVFPAEAMRTPSEKDTFLFGPSASDNSAGVTAMLALAAVLRSTDLQEQIAGDILFAGNVGEEGEGNLRGMRHLCTASPFSHRIGAAVVLDGPGIESIVTQGLGSRRFRVSVSGPGGHSWTDAGIPNPILVLSAALAEMQKVEVPRFPRTSWNVGHIEGGTAVNAIPEKVEARIDMRSVESTQLVRLEVALHRAVEDAVHAANSHASRQPKHIPLEYSIEMIGERPAARLPESARLLAVIRAVDRHMAIRSELRTASTDANIPLSLGVEAISIGSGGSGGGMHTREEWFDATGRDLGLRRILLLLLALMQIPE